MSKRALTPQASLSTSPVCFQSLEPRLLMSASPIGDAAEVIPPLNVGLMEITSEATPELSSTFGSNYIATNATDGNLKTIAHTATDDTASQLRLTFDQDHPLSKIVIHNSDVQTESFNTIDYYPRQTPSFYRKDAIILNGQDSLLTVTNNASDHVVGATGAQAGDRYRIHARWAIPQDADPNTPQILFNVGGGSHGYGVGWSQNQLIFIIKDDLNAYAYAADYIPDGEMVDIDWDWIVGQKGIITVNGVSLDVTEAEFGAGVNTTITSEIQQAFTIGGSAGTNTFKAVIGLQGISDLIGDDWTSGADHASGELAYFWIQRDENFEEVKDFDLPLDEGLGNPVDRVTAQAVSAENINWKTIQDDAFLYRWSMNSLDYNLANQTTRPLNVIGPGEFGLASWSDTGPDGIFGMPTMVVGPDGVISARTGGDQVVGSHSEIFAPAPLYNVGQYYLSWSLFIDSSAFQTPGVLYGAVDRILRINKGDGAGSAQGGFGFKDTDNDDYPVTRLFGNDITDTRVPMMFPFDEWFRVLVEYTPSDRNGEGGKFRASVDGGLTWPFEANHVRFDNYWFRIGTRTSTESARIFVTDLAYGSNPDQVYAPNVDTPTLYDSNNSRLRDITIRIRDAADTHDVFVSDPINIENSEFIYPDGPDSLAIDLVSLTGGTVQGGIVIIERAADPDLSGSAGQGDQAEANVLSISEVQIFVPEPMNIPLRISEVHYQPIETPDTEFIELLNISDAALDLTGIKLALDSETGTGIEYEFTDTQANLLLQPGEYRVIVRDIDAFAAQYPEVPDHLLAELPYTGDFADTGEVLTLLDPNGGLIQSFSYNADESWDTRASGLGPSLSIINPLAETDTWNLPTAWRMSGITGGTPGRDDPMTSAIPGDINYDGTVNIADLSKLAANFGRNINHSANDVRWEHGDLNADGIVNVADLSKLASRFNETGSNGFPEIGAAAMINDQAILGINWINESDNTNENNWDHIINLLSDESIG